MLFKVDLAPNKVSEVPKLAESPYPMRGSNGWLQQDGFILVSFSYEHYLLSYRPGTRHHLLMVKRADLTPFETIMVGSRKTD